MKIENKVIRTSYVTVNLTEKEAKVLKNFLENEVDLYFASNEVYTLVTDLKIGLDEGIKGLEHLE